MQEDGGRQQGADDVSPVHDLIEGVQLARVMEAGRNKRSQAKDEEMQTLGSAGTAVVNKKSDGKIEKANQVLIVESGIVWSGLDVDVVFLKFDAVFAQRITGRTRQRMHLPKSLRNIQCARDWIALNPHHLIANMQSRMFGGAVRRNMGGDDRPIAVNPRHSVIRKLEILGIAKMHKTQYGANDRCHRKDQQKSTSELVSSLAQ